MKTHTFYIVIVVFYLFLFYFIYFYFYFILFYFILFYFIILHFILFTEARRRTSWLVAPNCRAVIS